MSEILELDRGCVRVGEVTNAAMKRFFTRSPVILTFTPVEDEAEESESESCAALSKRRQLSL